jgi:hypothetical protein
VTALRLGNIRNEIHPVLERRNLILNPSQTAEDEIGSVTGFLTADSVHTENSRLSEKRSPFKNETPRLIEIEEVVETGGIERRPSQR